MRPQAVAQLPVAAESINATQVRHWRHERRRRRAPGLEIEVISWDGEGFDEDDVHRYALLACGYSGEDGVIQAGPEIRDRRGLPTMRLLDLVWRMASTHPYAINVMYGANYDWDHWIRDIDLTTARALKVGHPVVIGPWTVKSNGIWLEIGMGHGQGHFRSITVWDMWKFWGTRFDRALEMTFPDFHGLDVIKRFKDLRGRFNWEMMDEVAHYNQLELEALIMLTRRFFDDLDVAGVPAPSLLTGAGSLAGALDRKYGVLKHVGDQHFGDPRVEDAVLRGYSAGRVDAWRIGHVVPDRKQGTRVWMHDLISAYPSAMLYLPTMSEGSWTWVNGDDVPTDPDDRMSVWLTRWDYTQKPGPTDRYYPFFYRAKGGAMLYPPAGAGWQWWPEVVTARDLGWKFKVIGGWVWHPAEKLKEVRPYAWVPMIFARRAQLKAAGKEGPQRVLKYGLNALYGKMCQSRGATYVKPPKTQNLAWAGWVTSHCRASIMQASHQAPDSVLYQMTDSVVALEPLDVAVGSGLGMWEVEERAGALVAQAGVGSTWCLSCPDHPAGGEHPKYRGFDEGSVNAQAILEMWEYNQAAGWMHPVSCRVRRPITLAEAVLTEERWVEFGNWEDQDRDLDIYGGGGKRMVGDWEDWKPWRETYALEPTPAYHLEDGTPLSLRDIDDYCLMNRYDPISAPYKPAWSEQDPWSLPEVMGRLRERERQALE